MTRIGCNTQRQTFVQFCCILYNIVYYVGFIVTQDALATAIKPKAEWNFSRDFMFKFYKRLAEKCWEFFSPLFLCHFRILKPTELISRAGMSNRGSPEGHMGHICIVLRATHDIPDVCFLYSECFLRFEIVYHISKCKNHSE
jgi:hypothetical protein